MDRTFDKLSFYFQQGKISNSSSKCSDWLWRPPRFIYVGFWGVFPQGQSSQDLKVTRSPPSRAVRMSEAIASPPHMPSWYTEGQFHLYLNAEFITLSLYVAINLNYVHKQVALIVTILVH
jgi:hypothetical protein